MPKTETYRLEVGYTHHFEATGPRAAQRIAAHVEEMQGRAAERATSEIRTRIESESLALASSPVQREGEAAPSVLSNQASPRPGARTARRRQGLEWLATAVAVFMGSYIALGDHVSTFWRAGMVLIVVSAAADLIAQKVTYYTAVRSR